MRSLSINQRPVKWVANKWKHSTYNCLEKANHILLRRVNRYYLYDRVLGMALTSNRKALNMTNNSAILLSISLPGVLSQVKEEVTIHVTEEKEVGDQKITKRYDKQHLQRVDSIASKKTTISQEAVEYMVSNQVPDWYKAKWNQHKQWDSLTDDEKLIQHFARIAHPHTFSYTYIG